MAALTQDRNTPRRSGDVVTLPVEANAVIYAGAMVARNGDGNAVPASDTAGLRVVGRAAARADNSGGAAGAITVQASKGIFAYSHSGLGRDDIGAQAYAADDQTVALTGTNSVPAGIIFDVDGDGAWVRID